MNNYTAPFSYKIKFEAYTHSNDRVSEKDFTEVVRKGEPLHKNVFALLEDPCKYNWDVMRGGFQFYGTFHYLD